MNKELRKSFSNIKEGCDTLEKRKAYNKLVKSFNGKSITKDWLLDLLNIWKSNNYQYYDTLDLSTKIKNDHQLSNSTKNFAIIFITKNELNAIDLIENEELSKKSFPTLSDTDLYYLLKFLINFK